MEISVQQMRRRSTLLTNVFPFKKFVKAPQAKALSTLSPLVGSSAESLNFVPIYVTVRVVQASFNLSRKVGKSEYSHVFAKVSIGREKYETSQIEQAAHVLTWENETVMFEIPDKGNLTAITVGVYQKRRLTEECLGLTAVFLREFQPSQKERLRTCTLHSKSDPEKPVGEVIIAVAFKPCDDTTEPLGHTQHEFKGSSKSLNVFACTSSKPSVRRNSSFNTNRELLFPRVSKPVQYVTPVVKVTDTTDSSDSEEDNLRCVRSARGRVNSLFELDARREHGIVATIKQRESNASTTSQDDTEDKLPEEFVGKSKNMLVNIILNLREVISEQDEKVTEMQNYIDTRLAAILEANPALLETSHVTRET